MVTQGGGAVSYERGTPVLRGFWDPQVEGVAFPNLHRKRPLLQLRGDQVPLDERFVVRRMEPLPDIEPKGYKWLQIPSKGGLVPLPTVLEGWAISCGRDAPVRTHCDPRVIVYS